MARRDSYLSTFLGALGDVGQAGKTIAANRQATVDNAHNAKKIALAEAQDKREADKFAIEKPGMELAQKLTSAEYEKTLKENALESSMNATNAELAGIREIPLGVRNDLTENALSQKVMDQYDQLSARPAGTSWLTRQDADAKAKQTANESAADVTYKKALTTKALTEKNAIERPVKWVSKVDESGNTYQENPVTGETRDTGRKAPLKPGTAHASKEEMESIKEQSIAQIDEILKHPGFSDAVGTKGLSQGFGLRSKPIEGSDAAGFLARLEQIQGGSFLQARQMLKGGGAVTDFEGKKAESAMSRMSAAVSEKEFLTAAKDYKDALESGLKKLSPGMGGSGAKPNTQSFTAPDEEDEYQAWKRQQGK